MDTLVTAVRNLFAVVTGHRPQFRSHGGSNAENLALQNIQVSAMKNFQQAGRLGSRQAWVLTDKHTGTAPYGARLSIRTAFTLGSWQDGWTACVGKRKCGREVSDTRQRGCIWTLTGHAAFGATLPSTTVHRVSVHSLSLMSLTYPCMLSIEFHLADINPIGSISKTDLKKFILYAHTSFDLPILKG